jgi:hypothetical protein
MEDFIVYLQEIVDAIDNADLGYEFDGPKIVELKNNILKKIEYYKMV